MNLQKRVDFIKLTACGVANQAIPSILDIYEVVRTLVMASHDSMIIGWIQYHWSQLRLARSTLFPSVLLAILLPACMLQWQVHIWRVAVVLLFLAFLVVLQVAHYYYRERFMIYAMVGYFLTAYEPIPLAKPRSTGTTA